jgi:hypothetical protein
LSITDKTYWEVCIEINPICADVLCDIVMSNFDCEGIVTAEEKYKNILDNYETVIDNLSIDDVNILQKHFMEYKIPKYKTIKNITSFKNYVKRKIKYLLNDLIKNCGRAAQLYYTEKEKNNEQPKLSQRRIRLASPYVGSEINKD